MKIHISTAAFADLARLERWLADRDASAALELAPILRDAILSLRDFPDR